MKYVLQRKIGLGDDVKRNTGNWMMSMMTTQNENDME